MKRSPTLPLTSATQEIIEQIERDALQPISSDTVPAHSTVSKTYSKDIGHKKTGKKLGWTRINFSDK